MLGGTVDAEDVWHMVLVDGAPRVGVQLAPNHRPPEWPDGTPLTLQIRRGCARGRATSVPERTENCGHPRSAAGNENGLRSGNVQFDLLPETIF